MSTKGGCFIGACLSCVEIILYLYKIFLKINPNNLNSLDRDKFILSKGHDVPTLYSVLSKIGIIERGRLKHHLMEKEF